MCPSDDQCFKVVVAIDDRLDVVESPERRSERLVSRIQLLSVRSSIVRQANGPKKPAFDVSSR